VQKIHPGIELNSADLSLLHKLLDDECEKAWLGRAARVFFRLLEGVSYFLLLILSLAYLGSCLSGALRRPLGTETQTLVDKATIWLNALVLPALVALLALLIANVPLFTKAYRQWLLSRQLITLRLLDYAILPSPRVRPKLLVFLAPLGLLILSLSSAFGEPEPLSWRRAEAPILLVLLPGAIFLVDGLFRRLQVRLQYFEEVQALRNAFGKAADTSGELILPPELLTRIADVERTRVLRGNAEAVGHRLARSDTSYAVRKSDSAAATLRGLSTSERVRLERALEDLAARQEMSAQVEKAGPPSTLHVAGTPWQLVYEVEIATRTVHIVSVRAQRDYAP